MRKIDYISVPLWQGADKRGVEKAPQALLEAGVGTILEQYCEVGYRRMPELTTVVSDLTKYRVLSHYLLDLKRRILESYANGYLPFIVGGDHAIGLGSVAAAAERYDDLGIIWFDAHGDMNTESTSPSGHIHGMPLAAAMGLCSSELNHVATTRINPQHIFWIGTRSLDEGEKTLAEHLNLHIYSSDYIHRHGMSHTMATIQSEFQRMHIKHVHSLIDVDAMDPRIITATGVKEVNGLSTTDYNIFVDTIGQMPIQLTSFDFVEYNPLLDDSEKHSLHWCIASIERLMKAINK